MYSQSSEYFNIINREILKRRFYSPRRVELPPPIIIRRQVPKEPHIKIPLPIKTLNEEFHINKFKKILKGKNKKKNKENKNCNINLFLEPKINKSNFSDKSCLNGINDKNKKKNLFNYMDEFRQEKKIFTLNKYINDNNLFGKKSKNNYFNKSFDFRQINYRLKTISLNEKIQKANSMFNLNIKRHNQIKN